MLEITKGQVLKTLGETQNIPAGRPSNHVLGGTYIISFSQAEEKQHIIFPHIHDDKYDGRRVSFRLSTIPNTKRYPITTKWPSTHWRGDSRAVPYY